MFSRKEYLKKCQEEQEANGRVFQDFLEMFQSDAQIVKTKTWVKAGSFDAGTGREDDKEKGTLYEPKPLLKTPTNQLKSAIECARIVRRNERLLTAGGKKTTNLEALKEEIKQRHLERQKVKKCGAELPKILEVPALQDAVDPNSTNLYIGNINPKLTENDLMEMFGAYGPLASVKIMWPRGEEGANRSSHCGFVAYMSRKDAERAYEAMKGTDIKVSWGKFVDVPLFPMYIPPALQSLTQPPPISGLPFNAQPLGSGSDLYNSVVKVSIPTDKKLLAVIHRVIEFVIREGPLFEAVIMNREIKNPLFKFLFENTSAAHTYYRWKLYSLMNGEAVRIWSVKPFRMFSGGSIWIPPTYVDFSKGMPEHLIEKTAKKPLLSDTQIKRFQNFLRDLSLKRLKIAEAMVFCLNHADCASEIVEYIRQSLTNPQTNAVKKLSRLFLVSDILCNCFASKLQKFQTFIREFQNTLPEIFREMHDKLETLCYFDREPFKTRVSKVLREWELLKIYPDQFLTELENTFLDIKVDSEEEISDTPFPDDEDVLNIPLPATFPQEESRNASVKSSPGFIPSRWEMVDPDEVEAQAMSTKKFYHMEMQRKSEEEDVPSNKEKSISQKRKDRKRKLLRDIELAVLHLQVEYESGKKKLKKDTTLEKEVERYRKKLMRDLENHEDQSSSSGEDVGKHKSGVCKGRSRKESKNDKRGRKNGKL